MKCPRGHKLPHYEGKRECTPMKCAKVPEAKKAKKEPQRKKRSMAPLPSGVVAVEPIAVPARQEAVPQVEDPNVFLETALAARRRLVPVVQVGGDEDPVAVTEAHAARLLPVALAETEYQLKFGDARARQDAARDLFDMHGLRRKDAVGGGASTIILNVAGSMRAPWEEAKELPNEAVSARAALAAAEEAVPPDGAVELEGVLRSAGGRGSPAGGAGGEPDSNEAVPLD